MPRPKNDQSAVALFPFLAVLLCTMGSLILMLVVITRNQADRARRAAADAAVENEQAQAAALVQQRDELSWEIEQLAASRKKTAEQLADQRAELSHLEEHAQRLRTQLEELDAAEKLLAQETSLDDAAKAKLRAELEELRKKIAETEAKIAIVKAQGKRPPAFAIMPYDGENGTRRRPIYIECRQDSIVLHPEGTTFGENDFVGSMGPSNPLASCVRVVAEHYSRSGQLQAAEQPYPLLLVRPSGIGAYYVALEAMQSWDSDFGYELVDETWPLEFPPANPELAATLARTQNEARQRQVMIARAAPSIRPTERPTFRNAPPGNGLLEAEARSGKYAGGGRGPAGARGGAAYGGPGGTGSSPTGNGSTPAGNGYAGGSGGYGASGGGNVDRYADYKPSNPAGYGSGGGPNETPALGGTGTGPGGSGYGPNNGGTANMSTGVMGTGNAPTGIYGTGVGPSGNGLSSIGGGTGYGSQVGGGTGLGPQSNGGSGYAQAGSGTGYGSQAGGGSATTLTGTSNAVVTPTSFSDGPMLGNAPGANAGGGTLSGNGGISNGSNIGGAGSYAGGSNGLANNSLGSTGGGSNNGGSAAGSPYGTASNYAMSSGANGSSSASGGPGGGSSAAGNGTAASSGTAGSSGPGGTAGSSFGSNGSSSSSGGSSSGASSSGGSSGGGASSMGDPSMQNAGGMPNLPGNFQDKPSKNVESMAKRRGENWGLPELARRSTGVTRPVQVYCSSDRLTVFSDRGVPDKQINLGPRTEDSVDELVSTVWGQVEAWGMAGRSMYWKPTLSIHVAPDGAERYQELKTLLANSGLDVTGKEITVNGPKTSPQRR